MWYDSNHGYNANVASDLEINFNGFSYKLDRLDKETQNL